MLLVLLLLLLLPVTGCCGGGDVVLTTTFAFDEAFVAGAVPLTTSASRLSPPQAVTGGGCAETSGTPVVVE